MAGISEPLSAPAHVKLYVVASAEVRAERRHKELLERGEDGIYARVLQDMKDRDERDSNRAVAPLKPAETLSSWIRPNSMPTRPFKAALSEIEKEGADRLRAIEGRRRCLGKDRWACRRCVHTKDRRRQPAGLYTSK